MNVIIANNGLLLRFSGIKGVKEIINSNFIAIMKTKLNLAGALPDVEAMLKVRYSHKKFTLGLSAELYGRTKWVSIYDEKLFNKEDTTSKEMYGIFNTPTSLNLSLYADWHINKTCTVFAEGNNLLGDVKGLATYRWAFYREMGASFTVGVKVQF